MTDPAAKPRSLRREATPAEQRLWERLRDRRLDDAKFRRQHPVGRFVADFACVEARLIVELEGGVHRLREVEDALRKQQIEAQGEPVDRRFYLAGSYIAHQALLSGRIDAYVEYS